MSGTEFIPQTEDERKLKTFSGELSDALQTAIGPWVERTILSRAKTSPRALEGEQGLTEDLRTVAAHAGQAAAADLGPKIQSLLKADIDDQWTTPLALARQAVPLITATLTRHGVEPVARDAEAIRINPDDLYDVSPASFAEIDPELQMMGIQWGAAKSHIFLTRRAQAQDE